MTENSEKRSVYESYGYAMQIALKGATSSPDPSTQNGALLLGRHPNILDCNRFPLGVAYSDERWERPTKYKYVEHAERIVIFDAARKGVKVEGTTMVCPWAACSDCARAIVTSGVKKLVRIPANKESTGAHWHEDCEVGDIIMREGGVEIIEFTDLDALEIPELRRDGKIWNPKKETIS